MKIVKECLFDMYYLTFSLETKQHIDIYY